jgi:hypothetical protein
MMSRIRSDEVVASALEASDAGLPDAENAARHEVSIKTIRRWRRLYRRRGQARGQSHTGVPCPLCDGSVLDEAAYAELFGWYLGDGWLETHRRGVQVLHVYNDETYQDLNARIQHLMRSVKPGCRPHTRSKPGCLITSVGWKHWSCLFPQHGPGRKHERALTLADWQGALVRRHPAEFLRGLFHSDGARVQNWATRLVDGELRRYDYPRWQFVNHSPDIQQWCRQALDDLGIAWRQSSWKTISVSRREAVARLDELVGPKF